MSDKRIKFDGNVSFSGITTVDIYEDDELNEEEQITAAIVDLEGEIESEVASVYGVDDTSVNVDLSFEEA